MAAEFRFSQLLTAQSRQKVTGLPAAASCHPLSHWAWTVVIVVMVAVLRVGDLQAGLPLRLFAISRVRLDGARRAFLEEVRHEVHLRGQENGRN